MARARRHSATIAIAAMSVAATRHARAESNDDAPQVLVVQGSAAPAFTSTAREGERPRDAPDAASLMEDAPGVHVRRAGAEGGFATVSIRGSASNQVAVSFAGVPLTGAADPSLDLATLPLWPGATLRVHRTFAPATLGGGYLGGVVSIEPIELGRGARTELYDAYGSFGSYRLRATDVRALSADVRLGTGVSYARWDGDFTYYDPYRIPAGDRMRRNAQGAQLAGVSQARVELGAWSLVATAMVQGRRDGVPGDFVEPTPSARLSRDRELVAIEARRRDDDGRWLARVYLRREGRLFRDPARESHVEGTVLDGGAAFGRSQTIGAARALTLDARLELGAEHATTRSNDEQTRRRARAALAVDATYHPSPRLSAIVAARADLRDDVDSRSNAPAQREILPTAHLGAELVLGEALSLAAHAGALARPPSFLELLGDGATYDPSPSLRSEHSLAADVGLRARAAAGSFRFEAELTGFAARTTDFIALVRHGIGTLMATNVGEVWAAGGEATIGLSRGPLRVLASYTALLSRDATHEVAYRGRPLPGRPPHDLTVDASYALGPLTLRYGFDFVAATPLDRVGGQVFPARLTHDVGVRARLGGGLVLLGEVRNLFDRRTGPIPSEGGVGASVTYPLSDFLGYPSPGRRFTVSLRWSAETKED
jgi:outer membrane cobalamin receptor